MKKDIVMKRRMMSGTIVRLFAIVAVALLTVGIFASLSRETEVYASFSSTYAPITISK